MSLPHALLTSLMEKPSSGSELTRRFDKSIGFFWSATHQQIYRELARLEKAGWVESVADEGARGRKRQYTVLPAGRKELSRWMSENSEGRNLRDELMVRMRASALIGPQGLDADLHKRRQHHQTQLDLYREIEKRDFLGKPDSPTRRIQHLLLKAGIEYEAMYVRLCNEALEIFDSTPKATSGD